MKDNIILVGFMGTGKSAVSEQLARMSGWPAVDTDALIVDQQQQTIPDIFAEHGEAYFRNCETEIIKQVCLNERQVVATGGGAVLAEQNRNVMLENGFVVTLTADPETIIKRVSHNADRPLLAGDVRNRVYNMLNERKGAYDFAHLIVDTTDRSIEDIANDIWQTFQDRQRSE